MHQIVGYDASDRISWQRDIPPELSAFVKQVARVPASDPSALGAYPLSRAQALEIASELRAILPIPPKGTSFFLQPCEKIEP